MPIALLVMETVLAFTNVAYRLVIDAKFFRTNRVADISNHLSAVTFVAVAATSLVSTGLICIQIWRHTTMVSSRSRKHYQIIIDALIESSALYTVSVLFAAVLSFINTGNIQSLFKVSLVLNFTSVANQIITGLAPTVMIARLFVPSGQEDNEISSASLPSDLISHASHANGANMASVATDLEIQHIGFIAGREQESVEIQVVPRNDFNTMHGQPEDTLEDRAHRLN
ncbi:hypothetical protein D9613_010204 [Agrocybe pediades]|uniref:Uncharacterized protein n=1 Tax=Agrocybe pediades TaxID=84607 RepID=A0A8H4QFA0_9AGAR|nr:hypothetical protein D9613_010204 [Agrocybe pediades]